nr:CTP synthase [Maliibacterium massiliense]
MATKYVFITGGVVSSLGKGITAASVGLLLKSRGYKVSIQKLDPYMNVDPSLMSPLQHGEVFVTRDGAETDLDLGHYERFIDVELTKNNSCSAGRIYFELLTKERRGAFHGGTVQIIPHVTGEIKERIRSVSRQQSSDIVIVEIGGTVGDIESLPFLEAIRQMRWEVGAENCAFVHVTLMPYLRMAGEVKTKPTQHSVKELRSIGITPDIIVCRSETPLSQSIKEKIALFCNVAPESVVSNVDAPSLYEVPLLLAEERLDTLLLKRLGLEAREADLAPWRAVVDHFHSRDKRVKVALVGKYVALHDAYLSLVESLNHAGIALGAEVDISWIDAHDVTPENVAAHIEGTDAVLVPDGSEADGVEGMLAAIAYARTQGIPFLGIGMGMEMAAVEFARSVLGISDANSVELAPETANPIIYQGVPDGGRIGGFGCELAEGTIAREAYGAQCVEERHRHHYEFNNDYASAFALGGMVISGRNPKADWTEIIELKNHPWFVGVIYQPELTSRPIRPNALILSFVRAALQRRA